VITFLQMSRRDNPFEFSSLKFASEVLASSGRFVTDETLHQIEESSCAVDFVAEIGIKQEG